MADEEHPEGSGGGGGQEHATKSKTRQNEPSPPEPGQGEAASAALAATPAAPAGPPSGTSTAGDSSAVYTPPPPAGTSTDSSGERGISGALALWGPLIIIGFLVLVLNTDDAPQRPSATAEAPVTATSPPQEPEMAAEPPPVQPATQTAALEAAVEPVAESAEVQPSTPTVEPEVGSAEVDFSPATASSEQVVATAVVEPEATESVAPAEPAPAAPETPQIVAAAAEETAGEDVQSMVPAEELDFDTVLEVARSVIGQAGAETASQAVEAAPPPPASEVPAAMMTTEPQIVAPAPSAGVATGAWGAAQPDYQAAYPVWSSNPGTQAPGRPRLRRRARRCGVPAPPSQVRLGGWCRLAAASRFGRAHASSPSRSRDGPRFRLLAPASGTGALRTALLLVHRLAVASVPSHASGTLPVNVSCPLRAVGGAALWRPPAARRGRNRRTERLFRSGCRVG